MILRTGIDADELTKFIKEDFDNDSQDKNAEPTNENAQPKSNTFLDLK